MPCVFTGLPYGGNPVPDFYAYYTKRMTNLQNFISIGGKPDRTDPARRKSAEKLSQKPSFHEGKESFRRE